MASAQAVKAGKAYVEMSLSDSKLSKGLDRVSKRLKSFGSGLITVGASIAGAVSAATAPLLLYALKSAADAEEVASKFEALFREQTKEAQAFADGLAESVGRSRYELMKVLSTFQAFFVGMGKSNKEARALSEQMTELSLDFASFHNISDEDAQQRFIAALSGSGEVLDTFGVNIREATVATELQRMGIRKAAKDITEQEKVMARLSLIYNALSAQGAVGDATKTAGSFTNQMKKLSGVVQDAAVEIGKVLVPLLLPLVSYLAQLARSVGIWVSQNRELALIIFYVVGGVVALGVVLALLGVAISTIGVALAALKAVAIGAFGLIVGAVKLLFTPLGIILALVAAATAAVLYFTNAGSDALEYFGGAWGILRDDALAAWGGIKNAIAAGDLSLAFKIIWLTIKMEFWRAVVEMKRLWYEFKNYLIEQWTAAVFTLAFALNEGMAEIETIWADVLAVLESGWAYFVAGLRTSLIEFRGLFQSVWLSIQELFGEDVGFKKIELQQQIQNEVDTVNRERNERVAGAGNEAERRRKQIEKDRQDINSQLGKMEIEEAEENARARERDLQGIDRSQLDAAKAEFDAALAEAAAKAAAAEQGRAARTRNPFEIPIAAAAERPSEKLESKGTFNAAIVGQLGADNLAERQTKAAEEAARGIKQLNEKADAGKIVFV